MMSCLSASPAVFSLHSRQLLFPDADLANAVHACVQLYSSYRPVAHSFPKISLPLPLYDSSTMLVFVHMFLFIENNKLRQ
ncbi:hypothetical protein K457DRAFT_549710 [Linnemannia elongata AG-77]|uniref:Uncharacterized protein n=1 Tax=Linnemannia elongata AG-77 TaxID=1314771 RepID=A0A197JU34_9FUNG|nr:hypothetical protein K457DRAFT_549710 [Linnemannia elongata AG-77]